MSNKRKQYSPQFSVFSDTKFIENDINRATSVPQILILIKC